MVSNQEKEVIVGFLSHYAYNVCPMDEAFIVHAEFGVKTSEQDKSELPTKTVKLNIMAGHLVFIVLTALKYTCYGS